MEGKIYIFLWRNTVHHTMETPAALLPGHRQVKQCLKLETYGRTPTLHYVCLELTNTAEVVNTIKLKLEQKVCS